MPLYEYITADPEKGCRICKKGFEIRRPVSRPPMETCPLCRNPVKKLVSRGVSSPSITKPLSVSDAKKAGFTVEYMGLYTDKSDRAFQGGSHRLKKASLKSDPFAMSKDTMATS